MLFFRRDWRHPAWDPSSKKFINMSNVMIYAYTGAESPIPDLPKFPGQHLSVSPDSKLFVTDTQLGPFGGAKRGVGRSRLRHSRWELDDARPLSGRQGLDDVAQKPSASGLQRGWQAH